MKIEITTNPYNERRYSKPWIAKVDFKENPKGEFSFGDFIGQQGEEGLLSLINVNVGDIVATGQKDFRKPKNSTPSYFVVLEDGSLDAIEKVDAYRLSTKE